MPDVTMIQPLRIRIPEVLVPESDEEDWPTDLPSGWGSWPDLSELTDEGLPELVTPTPMDNLPPRFSPDITQLDRFLNSPSSSRTNFSEMTDEEWVTYEKEKEKENNPPNSRAGSPVVPLGLRMLIPQLPHRQFHGRISSESNIRREVDLVDEALVHAIDMNSVFS